MVFWLCAHSRQDSIGGAAPQPKVHKNAQHSAGATLGLPGAGFEGKGKRRRGRKRIQPLPSGKGSESNQGAPASASMGMYMLLRQWQVWSASVQE